MLTRRGFCCKCIATWGCPMSYQWFLGCFWPYLYCTVHMHTNCYFPVSYQNSDIAIRFSDRNFVKESNNLAVGWYLNAVTFTFDQMTLNIHSTSDVMITLYHIWAKSNNLRLSYWWFSKFSWLTIFENNSDLLLYFDCLRCNWGWKSRPNFALFEPCKH